MVGSTSKKMKGRCLKMKCKCGFQFAGPGEFRNCEAFVTGSGQSGVVCPKCNAHYIEGQEVSVQQVEEQTDGDT